MNPGKYNREQLRQNASEAAVNAANAASAAADYAVYTAAARVASAEGVALLNADVDYTYAVYVTAAIYADTVYTDYAAATGHLIDRYFRLSGEDIQDYIDEINRGKK